MNHFLPIFPALLSFLRGLVQDPETEAKKRTQRFSEVPAGGGGAERIDGGLGKPKIRRV